MTHTFQLSLYPEAGLTWSGAIGFKPVLEETSLVSRVIIGIIYGESYLDT